jgi:phytoene/squalene synthetase
MTPLEAMANAVADEIFGKAFPSSEARQEFCLKVARAALIALRDNGATMPMLTALEEVIAVNDWHETTRREFRAMLDAAIKEG